MAAVGDLFESQFPDWPLKGSGQRAGWRAMAILNTTPLQRHHRWRTILRLDGGAAGVDDHWALSQVLETTAMHDQPNISEIACMTVLARRFQLVEERYGLQLRESHSGS